MKQYGGVSALRPSDINSLGIVVAGLSPSNLAALTAPQLSAISAQATRHFTGDQISALSPGQVYSLSLDALAPLLSSGLLSDRAVAHVETHLSADDRALLDLGHGTAAEDPVAMADGATLAAPGIMLLLASLMVGGALN